MEQKTKHTPGPWIVHTFTISGKEKLEVLDATGTNACVQANAHLIAAAPAMYEALKFLTSEIDLSKLNVRKDFSLMNAHAGAIKVILQAEGKLL
jgi:hypothetical protein